MHFVLFPSPSEVRIVTHNHMDHTGLPSPGGAWIVTPDRELETILRDISVP